MNKKLKPIVIGQPDYKIVKCVDCLEKCWVPKEEVVPYRCSKCEDKREKQKKKAKRIMRRYHEAKKKMLKRNPNWPGRR